MNTIERQLQWLRGAIDKEYGVGTSDKMLESMGNYFEGLADGREESKESIDKLIIECTAYKLQISELKKLNHDYLNSKPPTQ